GRFLDPLRADGGGDLGALFSRRRGCCRSCGIARRLRLAVGRGRALGVAIAGLAVAAFSGRSAGLAVATILAVATLGLHCLAALGRIVGAHALGLLALHALAFTIPVLRALAGRARLVGGVSLLAGLAVGHAGFVLHAGLGPLH